MADSKNIYKSLTQQLDEVIDQLQSGDLDIDQAAQAYEKGMDLIRQLEKYIKTTENKVTKIKANFDKK